MLPYTKADAEEVLGIIDAMLKGTVERPGDAQPGDRPGADGT
jgi:hypothetical protein